MTYNVLALQNLLFNPWFLILIVWSLVWKYIAMWKAGRNNQLGWYIVFAFIHTLGILEIIYILFFRKNMNKKVVVNEVINKKVRKRKK